MLEKIDRLVKLQKELKSLYNPNLFIGVHADGVFVTEETLLEIPGTLIEEKRDYSPDYPFELSKIYKGVRFYALSGKSVKEEITEAEKAKQEDIEIMAELAEILE